MNKSKIDSIEDKDGQYLVTFCYIGKRQIFVKTAYQIYQNKFLIKDFSPDEAAVIVVYAAITYKNMINKAN